MTEKKSLACCESCRWLLAIQTALWCRRFPPTFFMALSELGRRVSKSSFPPVNKDMACGEYAPALTLDVTNH